MLNSITQTASTTFMISKKSVIKNSRKVCISSTSFASFKLIYPHDTTKMFRKKKFLAKVHFSNWFFMCEYPKEGAQSIATTAPSVTVYIFTIFFLLNLWIFHEKNIRKNNSSISVWRQEKTIKIISREDGSMSSVEIWFFMAMMLLPLLFTDIIHIKVLMPFFLKKIITFYFSRTFHFSLWWM